MADLPSSDFANGIPSVAQPAGDQKPLAPEKHETAQKRVFKQGQALPNNVHRASVQDHQEPTEGGSAALMQEVQMLREKLFKLGDRVAQMGHEIDQDQTTDTTHESDFEEHRSQRRRRKAAKWAEKRETRAAELQQHERVTQGAPFMHWIKEDGKFRFEDSLEPKTKWEQDYWSFGFGFNDLTRFGQPRISTTTRRLLPMTSLRKHSRKLGPPACPKESGSIRNKSSKLSYATDIRKWHANLIQAPEAPAPTGTAEESKAAGQETIHKGQPISGENVKPQDVSSEKEINPVSAIDPHGYSRSKETAAHLGCLIEFMDNRIAKRQAYLNSPSCSKVLFSDLWHLFKPGDFVISSDSKQVYQVFRVLLAPHCGIDPWAAYFQKPNDSDSDETDNFITICCVHINFDGYQLGPCYARLVPSIEGNHTTLPSVAVFPRLLKDITNGSNLTDDELLIMSYKVPGFVLRDRTWAWLDLDYLSDVVSSAEDATPSDHDEEDQGAFGQLVLPGGHKDMVLSLVSQHFRNKNRAHAKDEQTDIVGGKGLIILLHGAPGVGKTTTAEGVAERFKKPLFQITCGDLGSNVADVEAALQTNFALANKWDCALLLDEADVFLAERRRTDFHRNGLVAVFKLNLRLIKSRYASRNSKIKIDEDEILQTAGAHWRNEPEARWNGRQIRNACQTALALAEYEAQPEGAKFDLNVDNEDRKVHLTVSYLNKVTQAYLDFMKYLKAVHETDAERRARENGLRALESMAAAFANKDVNVNRGDGLAGWNVPQRSASPGNPHHWSNVSGYGQAPYPQDTRFCNTK
ncbi:hypothetical protein MCOR21_000204 [Pyricularia oryzae]|nr:hypothetical protein MCOR01_002292 [Pyricularia oryzae]KAI6341534.1 hypothetical protein MCOR30_002109 [Pyricularia oryzae]KAI6437976.1 hypothetical protein MCOR21_000204 [Pyricularia oryzae]KAI6472758.1 hypothetical protein MCOR15_000324 [Pyricularia oryzae]KAI6541763.1 hypothetical protein MCOR16_000481 [Pyricularia oryzae]